VWFAICLSWWVQSYSISSEAGRHADGGLHAELSVLFFFMTMALLFATMRLLFYDPLPLAGDDGAEVLSWKWAVAALLLRLRPISPPTQPYMRYSTSNAIISNAFRRVRTYRVVRQYPLPAIHFLIRASISVATFRTLRPRRDKL